MPQDILIWELNTIVSGLFLGCAVSSFKKERYLFGGVCTLFSIQQLLIVIGMYIKYGCC